MTRLGTAVAIVAIALMSFGTGAAVASIEPYTGPGTWFGAGSSASGQYDWCKYWTGNNFAKAQSAFGLATFITPSGGWRYSVQKYGNIFKSISSDFRWHKKPHCKNTSAARYQGGCWGDREDDPSTCI